MQAAVAVCCLIKNLGFGCRTRHDLVIRTRCIDYFCVAFRNDAFSSRICQDIVRQTFSHTFCYYRFVLAKVQRIMNRRTKSGRACILAGPFALLQRPHSRRFEMPFRWLGRMERFLTFYVSFPIFPTNEGTSLSILEILLQDRAERLLVPTGIAVLKQFHAVCGLEPELVSMAHPVHSQ